MKIILLDNIKKLGNIGEKVEVKNGYARNFLIPNKKAILATKKNINFFLNKKFEEESKLKKMLDYAKEQAKKLIDLKEITFELKSSNQGKLFGSINSNDISKKIHSKGIKILKSKIQMQKSKLRTIGKHKILIKLHKNLKVNLTVNIISK